MKPLDVDEEPVWRDLARFFVVAPRLLDDDLQRGAGLSLSEYTVLMNLSEAPDSRLRISELAGRAYLSGSRMTRLVDQLASNGYVEKSRSSADRRGIDVTLTECGSYRLSSAYPTHLASVRRRIMDQIDRAALGDFGRAIAAVVESFEDEDAIRDAGESGGESTRTGLSG